MPRTRSRTRSSNSRKGSMKHPHVGSLPASRVSFAAKLGAFICQNQKLSDVVGDVSGFEQTHNGRKVNQRVFGVLPFLHLNITRSQFVAVLNSKEVNGSLVGAVEALCNKSRLNSVLKAVDFHCDRQSQVGVRDGLNAAIVESIENRWDMRRNGRMVLNKIQAVQLQQNRDGKKIPDSSVQWCRAR